MSKVDSKFCLAKILFENNNDIFEAMDFDIFNIRNSNIRIEKRVSDTVGFFRSGGWTYMRLDEVLEEVPAPCKRIILFNLDLFV